MFRPVEAGRHPDHTHRGLGECAASAERFVAGSQFVTEDILINGPPWNIRVAMRVHRYSLGQEGTDRYGNRALAFVETRRGRPIRWEDYEDTARIDAWHADRSGDAGDRNHHRCDRRHGFSESTVSEGTETP
ncbi:MAG: hypothetical protein OEX04_19420 [Acidimicrobiia bacterium]|nr:hypothetical protein [Acidimicrobiia bacterium]MDH5295099.1 hypothetical protein [Acidimicrobiia bacterium]